MKQGGLWRLVKGYLGMRAGVIAFAALCALIFAVLCALLSMPMMAVVYGCALCAFLGAILLAVDMARVAGRHAELERLLRSPLTGADEPPVPQGMIEKDYDALLRRVAALRAQELEDKAKDRRAQSDYYALWAHQIKVPISAMRLLLRDQPYSAALSSELLNIEQYVDMTLGYERMNAQSTDYIIRQCALDQIVKQSARRFAPLFIRKKLKLDCRETGMTVLTDEKWLVFALEQLISNAVKYTRSGGTITIRSDVQSRCLLIEDNGIGIDEADLPRVFDQGYTGYNGRADKRATGLGLYLCKQALDGLGHTIAIQSQPGQGTTVTVGFPREHIAVE